MSSDALIMQEACQDIANLHTYSESVTPPWLSTQNTACGGRRVRQSLRFEILCVGEKLNCGHLVMAHCILVGGLSKLICSTLKSKLKPKNVPALH
jgi:hypothetical protein